MGSYVQNNLISGETVIYETKLHWIVFFSSRAIATLFIAPLVELLTSEFVITDKRIVIKKGFISIKTIELNLGKIESIDIDQTILGRILGYGDILVIGTGGTKEPFRNIVSPLEFRKQYQQVAIS